MKDVIDTYIHRILIFVYKFALYNLQPTRQRIRNTIYTRLNRRRPEQTTYTKLLPFAENIIPLFTFLVRLVYLFRKIFAFQKLYDSRNKKVLKFVFKYLYRLLNGYCKFKHGTPNATVTRFRI